MHRTEKLADHRSAGRPGCVPAMRSPIGVEAPKVPERRREGKTQPIMTARSARMATRDSPSDRVCEGIRPIADKLLVEELGERDGNLEIRAVPERRSPQLFEQVDVNSLGAFVDEEVVNPHGGQPIPCPEAIWGLIAVKGLPGDPAVARIGTVRRAVNERRHRCIPIRRLLPEDGPRDRWRPSDVDLLACCSCR
jgi:hypothetical protein